MGARSSLPYAKFIHFYDEANEHCESVFVVSLSFLASVLGGWVGVLNVCGVCVWGGEQVSE